MGMHTGITDPADVVFEPVSGRTIYTGPCMELARAVSDAAPGGGLLLSAEAFVRLPHSSLAPTTTVDELVNGGSMLTSSLSRAAATFSRSIAAAHIAEDSTNSLSSSPWLPTLDSVGTQCWCCTGTSFAPTGTATIAFANVVHAASLLSEVPTAARQALNTFQAVCLAALTQHQGYAVELVDGLLLAAFHEPWHAIVWALDCQQAMAHQAWPAELLDHLAGLGKPPRLDVGRVAATVMPQTGRIHYRGKVMNRAARVCSRCLPGQVLATGLVWEYSAQQGGLQAAGVRGDALGPAEMKGVPGLIELVHCYLGPPDCPA
ncbi:guanylate cyclase domain-containing protein, partial [Haematococcus lacustris]